MSATRRSHSLATHEVVERVELEIGIVDTMESLRHAPDEGRRPRTIRERIAARTDRLEGVENGRVGIALFAQGLHRLGHVAGHERLFAQPFEVLVTVTGTVVHGGIIYHNR